MKHFITADGSFVREERENLRFGFSVAQYSTRPRPWSARLHQMDRTMRTAQTSHICRPGRKQLDSERHRRSLQVYPELRYYKSGLYTMRFKTKNGACL